MNDPYDLERFVAAQNPVYGQVCLELRRGRKESHWIWFVFPQLKGLGHSWMANKFGISSLDEAEAYLRHPILGARLRECARLVNLIEEHRIEEIFGDPDDLKFRSSMTLFAQATSDNRVFVDALEKHFGGQLDGLTLEQLGLRRAWSEPYRQA